MTKLKKFLLPVLFFIGSLALAGSACHYCWGGPFGGDNSYCVYNGQSDTVCHLYVSARDGWTWCYYRPGETGLCVGIGNPG